MCNILKISATSWGEVVPSFSLKAKDAMSSKADVSKSVLILMGCWVANLLTSDLTCSLIFATEFWRAYSELTNTELPYDENVPVPEAALSQKTR